MKKSFFVAALATGCLSASATIVFGQNEGGGRPGGTGPSTESTVRRAVKKVSTHRKAKVVVPAKKTALDYEKSGDAFYDAKDFDSALAAYQSAIRLNPRQLKPLYRLGWIHNDFGEYQDAVNMLTRANAVNPNQAVVHHELGYAYSRLKRTNEAIASFKRAIQINSQLSLAYYELGSLYNDLSQFSEAESNLRMAVAIRPDHAGSSDELGYALRRLGRFNEAITAFKRSISLDAAKSSPHMGLGDVYHYGLKDYPKAIDAYLIGLRYDADNHVAAYNVGWGYNTLGRHSDAVQWLNTAVKYKPDYTNAHLELGYANHKLKLTPAALTAYQNALKYDANNYTAFTGLGDVYYEGVKNYSMAAANYEKAVAIKADSLTTLHRLGYCYNDMRRYSDALIWLEKARQLDAKSQPVAVELGYTYMMLNRFPPSEQLLKQVISANKDNAVAHYYLGQVYNSTGKKDLARREYNELVRLKSQYAEPLLKMINR